MSALQAVDLEVYRKALRSRKKARRLVSARRKIARRAASILKKEFGVKKVVVFGSLVHPTLFTIDFNYLPIAFRPLFRGV